MPREGDPGLIGLAGYFLALSVFLMFDCAQRYRVPLGKRSRCA
jgi:hypothetical protein